MMQRTAFHPNLTHPKAQWQLIALDHHFAPISHAQKRRGD